MLAPFGSATPFNVAVEPVTEVAALVVTDGATISSNWAVTVIAVVIDTMQVPVHEQPPPLQPIKTDVLSAAAVSVTLVSAV